MDVWGLPGPAAFLHSLKAAVRDGENIVVGVPETVADDVLRAVENCLQAAQWSIIGPFKPEARNPLEDVCIELGLGAHERASRSIAGLIEAVADRCLVLVYGVPSDQWPIWHRFLEEYASACRSRELTDRAQIVVIVRGIPIKQLPRSAPALTCMIWDGVVGEADVLGYAMNALKSGARHPPCLTKVIVRTVTALALWDFDLADQLIAVDWRSIFSVSDLRVVLTAQTSAGNSFTWETGGSGTFDGTCLRHTASLLAEGDPEGQVAMRLWAAQASELFPILELCRRDLVKRMKGTNRVSTSPRINGESVGDLADVEIGGLLYLAQVCNLPSDIVRTAAKYRRLRNKLAHLEPLSADELCEFLVNRSH